MAEAGGEDERGPFRRLRGNFVQWSRLENWARVAGLMFGALGSVAAIGTLNFFAEAPDVLSEASCADDVRGDLLHAFYADAGRQAPEIVQAIAAVHTGDEVVMQPEGSFVDRQRLPEGTVIVECASRVEFKQARDAVKGPTKERLQQARFIAPFISRFVAELLLLPGLSSSERRFALEATQESRVAVVTVVAANTGGGGTQAQLRVPAGYSGNREPVHLEAGERHEWKLQSEPGTDPVSEEQFVVTSSKEEVVDVNTLKTVALLLIGVVLLIAAWDIAGPREGWRDSVVR